MGREALTTHCESFSAPYFVVIFNIIIISAGKDAARAYTTGCFQTHLTHDIRGLNEKELKVR